MDVEKEDENWNMECEKLISGTLKVLHNDLLKLVYDIVAL
jgi:hypothetical protein